MENTRSEPLITEFLNLMLSVMEKNQISKSELARRLGTSKAWISKVFQGENLSIKTMAKMAEALHCRVNFQFLPLNKEKL